MDKKALKNSLYATGILLTSSVSAFAFTGQMSIPVTQQDSPKINALRISMETTAEEAQIFIKDATKEGIKFLEDKSLTKEQKKEKFRAFLNDNFDLVTIGRFALGKYWRSGTKEQKKEYLNLFENMIVDVYSERFSEYESQNIEVTNARPQGKADMLVNSKIIQKSGPEIALDWRVRKKDGGKLKIIDISVEGISMSLTQRSDFAAVIQRGGGNIDVLLDHLRSK